MMSKAKAKPFDRDRAAALVLTWPDNSITVELHDFLASHYRPDRTYRYSSRDQIDIVRCRSVVEIVARMPPDVEEVTFIDRDMRPGRGVAPFMQAVGDVVACEYPVGNPQSWADPGAFHMGLVRVGRYVLDALLAERCPETGKPIPLFWFPRTEDNTRKTACECVWFARRVVKAGFRVVRAGWCGHRK